MPRTKEAMLGDYAYLLEKYPNALANVYCGFDCGKGWLGIVEPIIAMCEAKGIEVHQIKEKFGGLRFYVGGLTDELRAAIDDAEAQSFKTCERCGAPGSRRGGSWIKTLCDGCCAVRDAAKKSGNWDWWNQT